MTHEVVAALIVQSQKILLGQRSAERKYIPDMWDVFGGHIEPGEEHEQTLARELEEELGITLTQWKFLDTLTLSYPAVGNEPPEEWITHLFLVTSWSGTPVNRQQHEHTAIGWFSLEEVENLHLAHPGYPTLFARYMPTD